MLTNYSGIEQNGFVNQIPKIEINIPNNLNYIKNVNNYNNSNVLLKNDNNNQVLIIKNFNIWECITIE